MRYQIEKSDRNGDFEAYGKPFSSREEAVSMARHWSSRNPNCAWGVRVIDTMDQSLVWED